MSGKRSRCLTNTQIFRAFIHFVLSWMKNAISRSLTSRFSFLPGEKHFVLTVLVLIRLLRFYTATYCISRMPCSSRISAPDRTVQSGDSPENVQISYHYQSYIMTLKVSKGHISHYVAQKNEKKTDLKRPIVPQKRLFCSKPKNYASLETFKVKICHLLSPHWHGHNRKILSSTFTRSKFLDCGQCGENK